MMMVQSIKRWAKEFMDEIKCPFVKVPLEKEAHFLKSTKNPECDMDISDFPLGLKI
jgi:excinuclease ABC subunit A